MTEAETKIPRFCHRDWVSLVAAAEHMTQVHRGIRVLALVDIHDALKGGCRSLLQSVKDGRKIRTYPPPEFWHPPNRLDWVNALNLSQRLADFPDRPWPWELRVALTPSEWESLGAPVDVFLRRADAVRWGLWQAKPEPTEIAEATPEPVIADPAPAPPTEPPQVDPAPYEAEPAPPPPIQSPPEEAEQQRPPLLLPDEPQFEEPRKWRPDEARRPVPENEADPSSKAGGEQKRLCASAVHAHDERFRRGHSLDRVGDAATAAERPFNRG